MVDELWPPCVAVYRCRCRMQDARCRWQVEGGRWKWRCQARAGRGGKEERRRGGKARRRGEEARRGEAKRGQALVEGRLLGCDVYVCV